MSKLEKVSKENASKESIEIFESLESKVGMVPNVYATLGNSAKALKATLSIGEILQGGEFNGKETEAIALAVAQTNDCGYCLAAHTAVGKSQGLSEDETVALRNGSIEDDKLKALTDLAKSITEKRGYPSEDLVDNFFDAGYNQAALSELIVLVGLNTITNYTNHIAQTEIDFPEAPELAEA